MTKRTIKPLRAPELGLCPAGRTMAQPNTVTAAPCRGGFVELAVRTDGETIHVRLTTDEAIAFSRILFDASLDAMEDGE